MFKKLLVTVDGSKTSEAILPHVVKAAGPHTRVTLLTSEMTPESHVVDVHPSVVAGSPAPGGTVTIPANRVLETTGQAIERVREEKMRYLEALAAPLRAAGLAVETMVVFGWDAGEDIVETAKRLDVDVIFMATHGRTALGQIVFGSVAERVMHEAPCPVLLVRPAKLN
ncbi:MAG: universal stress protein [Chloroflexota bacterium]